MFAKRRAWTTHLEPLTFNINPDNHLTIKTFEKGFSGAKGQRSAGSCVTIGKTIPDGFDHWERSILL